MKVPQARKLRVLCLHSFRTSGAIFKQQVRSPPRHLPPSAHERLLLAPLMSTYVENDVGSRCRDRALKSQSVTWSSWCVLHALPFLLRWTEALTSFLLYTATVRPV